jgi:signal transduction histidine kinase
MKPSAYPEAAFLSKVTASATHELRNVLAIIKESSGLMGDMVQICTAGGSLDPERIGRTVDRVDTQVRRGANLLTGLNRLAHCLDVEKGILDLREEVDLAVFMSRRKARNRRQEVEVTGSEANLQVSVSPIHLQMALYAVLEVFIEGLPERASISVSVAPETAGTSVTFSSEAGIPEDHAEGDAAELWEAVRGLVVGIGARMDRTTDIPGIRILFDPA